MNNRKDTLLVHTTVRIPTEVHERLRVLAEANHRSVSAEVRRLIDLRIQEVDDSLEKAA